MSETFNYVPCSGIGYDVHQFASSPRPLMLGGVEISPTMGLEGHSDADVLCHAIADALLGAAGLPDIGYWFPPSDDSIEGISSLKIVQKAVALIKERHGRVINIDSTLIAEAPKILPYLPAMKLALSNVLEVSTSRVGVKATTNEKMGFVGRKEGMAAFAVASVLLPDEKN